MSRYRGQFLIQCTWLLPRTQKRIGTTASGLRYTLSPRFVRPKCTVVHKVEIPLLRWIQCNHGHEWNKSLSLLRVQEERWTQGTELPRRKNKDIVQQMNDPSIRTALRLSHCPWSSPFLCVWNPARYHWFPMLHVVDYYAHWANNYSSVLNFF